MDPTERAKKSRNMFGDFNAHSLCNDKTNRWKIGQKFKPEHRKVNGLKALGGLPRAGQESWLTLTPVACWIPEASGKRITISLQVECTTLRLGVGKSWNSWICLVNIIPNPYQDSARTIKQTNKKDFKSYKDLSLPSLKLNNKWTIEV